jgi:hypothetical protein
MTQASLFDRVESNRRKDVGKERASSRFGWWLSRWRDVAEDLARDNGTVCADDVQLAGAVLPDGAHHNLWGSLFSGDDRFEWVGYVKSGRKVRHAGTQGLWRLK